MFPFTAEGTHVLVYIYIYKMFCFSFFRIIIIILSTYCLLLFSSEQLCESLYCFLFGCRVHSLLHYQLHSTSLDQITTYTFLSTNFSIIRTRERERYIAVFLAVYAENRRNINSVGGDEARRGWLWNIFYFPRRGSAQFHNNINLYLFQKMCRPVYWIFAHKIYCSIN